MSRITIHLDNFTAAKLSEWRGVVDASDAIKAMIHMSRHDPYIGRQVSNRLHLHPAGPQAAMSRITIHPDNQTDLDLKQWSDQGDAAAAIRAMIHVTLHDAYISRKVMGRLADQRVPGVRHLGARVRDPVSDREAVRPPARPPVPPTPKAPDNRLAPPPTPRPSPGTPRIQGPRGPSPF